MYWESRNGHTKQIQVTYNTRPPGEEKSLTFFCLNIDIASGNVWGKLISRPFTLNMFKQFEQHQNCVYHICLQNAER